MAFDLNDDGVTLVRLRHVEVKPDGSFQYRRRIPAALKAHFPRKTFFVRALGRNRASLSKRCYDLSSALEGEWIKLGWLKAHNELGDEFIPEQTTSDTQHKKYSSVAPTLSVGLALYLKLHANGERPHFRADCQRAIQKVIEISGDLPIDCYSRDNAEKFRDALAKTSTTSTIRRRLTTIVAVINRVRKEKQLQILNPFEGLGIAGEGEDGIQRLPFTGAELSVVSLACRNLDDDIRHIIALQKDTGCRVAEVVGLRVEDVILEKPIPHIRIRPWGKVRTLKTPASERDIPLIGDALWAAERALEGRRRAKEPDSWLFPRYASDQEIKATHASNTLNKWLRGLDGVYDQKTTHCFRHAFRDRLRAAQVPLEIQDCLGGWGSRSVGQGYGSGYPLQVLAEHMTRAINLQIGFHSVSITACSTE